MSTHSSYNHSSDIPNRAGVGLKPEHYHDILKTKADIGWFEVHPENYMGAGGPPHHFLTKIRENYPLSLHGVGLSIGGSAPLNKDHLRRLKNLIDRYQPGLFSEHLAWSTHDDTFLNDLLPLPYTEETLKLVCEHIDQVQDYCKCQLLLENPSTYLAFAHNDYSEIQFISELTKRTGCSLLLDINNVFVSCTNHSIDPHDYICHFPLHAVQEFHLAGYTEDIDDDGETLLIDSHDREVLKKVWDLYELALTLTKPKPTLIEWDANIPDWPTLLAEAKRADSLLQKETALPKSAYTQDTHLHNPQPKDAHNAMG